MNNTAWQNARRKADLSDLRVHDLRHTFASRLRQAHVAEQTVSELFWHSKRSMTQHYMLASLQELLDAVELIAIPRSTADRPIDEIRQAGRDQLRRLEKNGPKKGAP